jgi:hypothetical protein
MLNAVKMWPLHFSESNLRRSGNALKGTAKKIIKKYLLLWI